MCMFGITIHDVYILMTCSDFVEARVSMTRLYVFILMSH